MLGGILLIAGVVAAVLVMLGVTELAKRLCVIILLIAVVVPCLTPLLTTTAHQLDGRGLGWIVLFALGAIFIAGWVRFVNHRRQLHHFWGEGPSSLKHRVEDDV